MPQERIPFGNQQSSGLDELGGASPVAMNIVTEVATGAVRRRPGIASYMTSAVDSRGVTGLYETVDGQLFAVAGQVPQRNIYRIVNGAAQNLTVATNTDLRGSSRPTFAETESILAMAGGDAPQKVLLSKANPQGSVAYQSSRLGGSPPNGSHIIANNDCLLSNDVSTFTNHVQFSNQAAGSAYSGYEDWTTSLVTGFFSVDARPDPVVAVHENTNEIFCFGTTSLQVFSPSTDTLPDGTKIRDYPPVVTMEVGCAAPYSVVKVDQNFAVLDHLRRFTVTDGRTTAVISDAIQRTLNDMSTVSDCYGYRFVTGPLDLLVWVFPTDGRSFAYQKGAGWSEWSSFSATTNNWGAFAMTAACNLKSASKVLIGNSSGQLGTLAFGTSSDFGGATINAFVETGFISHGTENRKSCNSVTFALRRGETSSSSEPCALLSWRDNTGPWEEPIQVSLGATADYDPTIQIYSLGVYRRRQWRLEFTGAEDVIVASVIEDFTVLDMVA